VGTSKGVSPFGIYDMIGNAGEWTASDFKAYPNGKLTDVYAGKTNLKTIRGGSFGGNRNFATTAYRIGWRATGAETYNITGFRCVKDIDK
jgi:formylglycine-generating enzyme required for sulfatase activity